MNLSCCNVANMMVIEFPQEGYSDCRNHIMIPTVQSRFVVLKTFLIENS